MSTFMDAIYDNGAKYIDHGISIFPISITSKKPLNSWVDAQKHRATHDDLEDWVAHGAPTTKGMRVPTFNIAMATGALSGVVVVDCDDEVAISKAQEIGLWSPIRVRTRRGMHLYFKHPGSHVKTVANGLGWHRIDIRGDGGYVLLPPSISERSGVLVHYHWEIDAGAAWDDMPVLPDLSKIPGPPGIRQTAQGEDFIPEVAEDGTIDLTNVSGVSWMGVKRTISDQLAERVNQSGKLTEGDGRNPWLTRFVGEQINKGVLGEELRKACVAFCDTYMADPLDDEEIDRTCRSLEDRDKKRHPERYDANGDRIGKVTQSQVVDLSWAKRAITAGNIEEWKGKGSGGAACFVDPIVPVGKLVQVHGAPGTGKSMVLTNALYNASLGRSWGSFVCDRQCRVLYVDYDNPIETMVERYENMMNSYGPSDSFLMFSKYEAPSELNLRTERGIIEFYQLIQEHEPDVIVIDSVRNAWVGMEENSSDGWAAVNMFAGGLRQKGFTVILVHHSNKPDARTGRLGSSAGSLAQLTLVDLQAQIVRVLGGAEGLDEEAKELLVQQAHQKNAIVNEQIFARMKGFSDTMGTTLRGCYQVLYGKIRGDESNCNPVCLALTIDDQDRMIWLGDKSNRQKAQCMFEAGYDARATAQELELPRHVIERWRVAIPRSIFDHDVA